LEIRQLAGFGKKPSGKAGLNPLTSGTLREEKRGAIAQVFERGGHG
jgi:hypothetical protein